MSGLRVATLGMGLCVVLAAGSAWADSSPFVGRWHWNRAQSTMPPGEPVPSDITAEISRADSAHLKWSLTVLDPQSQPNIGSTLQGTFKGPSGEVDDLTCTVASNQKTMTCKGVLSDGQGHTANYADVYDRM